MTRLLRHVAVCTTFILLLVHHAASADSVELEEDVREYVRNVVDLIYKLNQWSPYLKLDEVDTDDDDSNYDFENQIEARHTTDHDDDNSCSNITMINTALRHGKKEESYIYSPKDYSEVTCKRNCLFKCKTLEEEIHIFRRIKKTPCWHFFKSIKVPAKCDCRVPKFELRKN